MTYLFHLGGAADGTGSDLQAGLSCREVDEVEAKTAPISCQFTELLSLPWAVKGSGADSAALARGKGWKQPGFGMSL